MKGLCQSCLSSNVDVEIRKNKVFCSKCWSKYELIGTPGYTKCTPKNVEFSELETPTKEKRCGAIEDFAEEMFEKLKNSLIDGVPE